MFKQKKAFTLVELIVVITILAILWTIAFISLQWYSRDARNSVRMSDIKNIKTSLELLQQNTWKYPNPDNWENVTYSWWTVWTQWVVWDQVVTNLDKLSNKPLDPLTGREYVYSLLNTKQEYELWTIIEWETLGLLWVNDSYAASNQDVIAHITWNYNWVLAKVSTWSITYILAVPSIISTDVWDLLDIITNKQLSYDWFSNLWKSYSWTVFEINWAIDLTLTNKLLLYSWELIDLRDSDKQVQFISDLQLAYLWTEIINIWEIESILLADTTNNIEWTQFLAQVLIKNTIDHTMPISSTFTNTTETPPAVSAFVSTWNTANTWWITASNQIKLPLRAEGVYDFIVDWWDSSTDNITLYNQAQITHTYTTPWVYDVTITWNINWFTFANSWDKTKLIEIKSWGPLKLGSTDSYFWWCTNLTSISASDLPDLTWITSLGQMFSDTQNLSNITNINSWDVSWVTDMYNMFAWALLFNQDIWAWNVSNLTNMPGMFWMAHAFNQNLSWWDVSSVTSSMFYDIDTPAWEALNKPVF